MHFVDGKPGDKRRPQRMIIHAVTALVQKWDARLFQILPELLHFWNAIGQHQIVCVAIRRFVLLQRLDQFLMQRQCLFLAILVHLGMNPQQPARLAKHQIRPAQCHDFFTPQPCIQWQQIGHPIFASYFEQLNRLRIRQRPPPNPFLAARVRPFHQFKGIDGDTALFTQPRPEGRKRGQIFVQRLGGFGGLRLAPRLK